MKLSLKTLESIIATLKKLDEREKGLKKWLEYVSEWGLIMNFSDDTIYMIKNRLIDDYECWSEMRQAITHFCRESEYWTKKMPDSNRLYSGLFYWDKFYEIWEKLPMLLDSVYLTQKEFEKKYKFYQM